MSHKLHTLQKTHDINNTVCKSANRFMYLLLFIFRVHTQESSASALTNAQIAEHYANCVKLSSENVSSLGLFVSFLAQFTPLLPQKINAKNAFGLHLINYMMEMLRKRGEMTNFQVCLRASLLDFVCELNNISSG